MKVRIGVGAGAAGPGAGLDLARLVDDLDELGFDSLWLPEVLTAPVLDPLTALSFAAAHNPRLKLGTTMVLPGRNPLRLAKELATLDALSGGRLLVTFVPGIPRSPEAGAVGTYGGRGAVMDELLPLLRRLWAGERVTTEGSGYRLDDVALAPLPAQQPLEMWTGGMATAALVRCGRHADGWLPSACTPEEVATGRRVIEEAAAAAGRSISDEHFGVSIAYATRPLDATVVERLGGRGRRADPAEIVPVGLDALRDLLERFVAVGSSKFVVRPLEAPDEWPRALEALADAVLDLQT